MVRAGSLKGLPHPGREAGLFHRQRWTADEQKEGLSITAHVAVVGEQGREEKEDAGTSSDRLLSIYSRGVL